MKFENAELKTTFEVPDNPTYREMLAYEEEAYDSRGGRPLYERLWAGVCTRLVTAWDSEILPERKPELIEQEYSPRGIEVIKWAGLALFSWALDKRQVPKNS